MSGWVGVDLDGTLAFYQTGHFDPAVVGAPIPKMVERVKAWLADGVEVRIFTARVSTDGSPQRDTEAATSRAAIEAWCLEHLGAVLPVTNLKDYAMIELYDDRAVQVAQNTGEIVGYSTRGNHV
jgi:hypothetical protein